MEDPLQGQIFERLVGETLQHWRVPGMAIAVLDGPKTWHKGFGYSRLPDRPVKPTTNFYAGSTTKAFVAAEMSRLVCDNKNHPNIQWTTPVKDLIPDDFVLEDDWATNHITIEDILSHRTGMPTHERAHGRKPMKSTPHDLPRAVVRESVRSMRYLPLTAEPRTRYQYCNLMYVTAAHVIETVTGTWLGKTLERNIWKPLEMHGTYFAKEDAIQADEDLAQGYKYNEGRARYEEVGWMNLDSASGAGSVISNVVDYTKWIRALYQRSDSLGELDFDALMAPRTLIPSTEPYTAHRAYALGWRIGVYKGQRIVHHSGGMNCFGAELFILPDREYAFVAFGNTATSSNFAAQKLGFHLIDEKLNIPAEQRFDFDKQNQRTLDEGKAKAASAKQRLYPNLPQETLPLTRPIAAYAGTYHHPGYQTLVIFLDQKDGILRADRNEVAWPEHMAFEHVSGNYFLIRSEFDGDFAAWFPDVYTAEFRIGADGAVSSIGITWEEAMGDKKIWLDRI